jgi:aryl-alcohol dehydrogenase-like predicted oxidoreductase
MLGHHDFQQQNTEAEGHEQMDYALEKGVNFWDTAEMYSVLHVKPTKILKKLLEPGSKKQEEEKRLFSFLK